MGRLIEIAVVIVKGLLRMLCRSTEKLYMLKNIDEATF